MQRRRSSVGFAVAIAAIAQACATPSETAPPEVVADTTVVVPKALELDFDPCEGFVDDLPEDAPRGCTEGSVSLRVVSCSANLSCDDSFLADPLTLERGPTLMTGFSCGFGDGIEQDALLAFHPDLRCYTGFTVDGGLTDRTSWLPAGGIPIKPQAGEHVFFSRTGSQQGDVYTNSATLLRPLRDYAFCELHAWGSVAFSDMVGTRSAEHVTRAPAVEWRTIVQWTDAGWDCHLGDPELTSLERVVLASATHDRPLPTARVLPASRAVVLIREEPLETEPGVRAALVRFSNNSWFPLGPGDAPEPLTERQLWVNNPNTTVPTNLHITASHALLTPTGGVAAIGMSVSNTEYVPLGVVVVCASTPQTTPGSASRPWDCERDEDGACLLWGDEWEDESCLVTP